MVKLGWTTSEFMQEHLQTLVSQGYMMAAELTTCRVPEDPASPILGGGMSWHAWRSMSGDLVCHHTNFSTLCYSSTAWNCIT
jgi:hypothetical protein